MFFRHLPLFQSSKIWLGNQEAFSGDFWIVEEVIAFEGNGCRPSHQGIGISDEGVMYTLNTTEVHGVMYRDKVFGIDQSGGKGQAAFTEDVMPTLLSDSHGTPHAVCYEENAIALEPGFAQRTGDHIYTDDISPTLRSEPGDNRVAVCVENKASWIDRHLNMGDDDLAPTLCAKYGTGGNNMPCVMDEPMVYDHHPMDSRVTPTDGVCQTISTRFGEEYSPNSVLESHRSMSKDDPTKWVETDVTNTLNTFDQGETRCAELVVSKKGEEPMYVVRRITPKECERLQGFPDDYTDIPWKGDKHSPDSRRYKALGNSMAVPVMRWIAERIDWSLAHPITEVEEMHIDYQPDLF